MDKSRDNPRIPGFVFSCPSSDVYVQLCTENRHSSQQERHESYVGSLFPLLEFGFYVIQFLFHLLLVEIASCIREA